MEIHPSARKHGIHDDAIRHATERYAYTAEIDADEAPERVLYIGPDRAGNLLEVVVIARDDGSELAIHAMRMRKSYRSLLPRQEDQT